MYSKIIFAPRKWCQDVKRDVLNTNLLTTVFNLINHNNCTKDMIQSSTGVSPYDIANILSFNKIVYSKLGLPLPWESTVLSEVAGNNISTSLHSSGNNLKTDGLFSYANNVINYKNHYVVLCDDGFLDLLNNGNDIARVYIVLKLIVHKQSNAEFLSDILDKKLFVSYAITNGYSDIM